MAFILHQGVDFDAYGGKSIESRSIFSDSIGELLFALAINALNDFLEQWCL